MAKIPIPENTWKAAGCLLDRMIEENPRSDLDPQTVAARAIMEEREGCAIVAEDIDGFPQEGARIAAMIRARP
jgi:hypothetical protein